MPPRRIVTVLCGLMVAACTTAPPSGPAQRSVPPTRPAAPTTNATEPSPHRTASPGHRPSPHSATPTPAQTLHTAHRRRSAHVVAAGPGDAPYNYGPTVMASGGGYRMWWCSQMGIAQPPGDDILYGRASTLDGPFVAGPEGAKPILSGSWTGFDSRHTCDPSIIKVAGMYYMYYTGSNNDENKGNAIGLATSVDGVVWQRAGGGGPIVTESGDTHRANAYGVGQPSAAYVDGWYYLMFTDTSGAAAGPNGAGQFVLRSRDPAFGHDVQSLGPAGFGDASNTVQPRQRSVADAFSSDLMYSDVLGAFALAHQTKAGTTITFWDTGFTRNPYAEVTIGGPWQEGPGLVRSAWGHAPIDPADRCGTVPLDLVRATADPRAPTDLRHYGVDLVGAGRCRHR